MSSPFEKLKTWVEEDRKKGGKKIMVASIIGFTLLTIPLVIVTDNPGMLGIGPAIGVSIGMSLKGQENQKPPNKKIMLVSVVLLALGALAFLALFMVSAA